MRVIKIDIREQLCCEIVPNEPDFNSHGDYEYFSLSDIERELKCTKKLSSEVALEAFQRLSKDLVKEPLKVKISINGEIGHLVIDRSLKFCGVQLPCNWHVTASCFIEKQLAEGYINLLWIEQEVYNYYRLLNLNVEIGIEKLLLSN